MVVVAGRGGVGKTTISAALAIGAARRIDGDVLVLTIDPARRLASALGIDIVGNEAVIVDLADRSGAGRLHAAMLDPSTAWDDMVRAEAPDAATAAKILDNPVYRRIADTFVHGNDYAALGWLDSAIASGRFDLIIVDTPPSQNALGLYDAPDRVEEFFTSSLLGWLTKGQSGRTIGGPAARSFGAVADRLLGSEFFGDVVEFFQLMQTVVPGMVERTRRVSDILIGDSAAFLAVAAPAPPSLAAASELAEEMRARDLALDAMVVNGVEPDVYWDPKVADVANRVVSQERSPFSASATQLLRPGAEYVARQCHLAELQASGMAALESVVVGSIPRMVHSPTTVEGLGELGELFWSPPGPS